MGYLASSYLWQDKHTTMRQYITSLLLLGTSFMLVGQGQWAFRDIGDGTKPSIHANGSDIHIAALKEDISSGFLAYFTIDDLGQTTVDTVLDNYFYGPIDITTDALGLPHIGYHHHLVGPEETRGDLAISSLGQDGNWSIAVTQDLGHDGWDGSMVIDDNGVTHTVSTDPTNGIEYSTLTEGTWRIESIDTVPAMYQYGTDIELDAQGDVHVAYFTDQISTLKYANRSTGAWIIETIDTDAIYPSMILTDAGPVIAYYKSSRNPNATWLTSGEVMIATRASDGTWTSSLVEAISDVAAGSFTGARAIVDLQVDSQGEQHLAFANDKIVRYGIRAGDTWSLRTIFDTADENFANIGQQVSLAIDENDVSHLVTYRRTNGNDGIVMYGSNDNESLLPTVICPADTTISCDALITPDDLGRPTDTGEFTRISFIDSTVQSCPMDLIIDRYWIGYIDDLATDTCIQRITIEVDAFDDFSIQDTIRVDEVCVDDLGDIIERDLDLPCNVDIDSIRLTEIERNCDRIVLGADWEFRDECRDTTINLLQTIIIENRTVAKLGTPIIFPDTGRTSGSITLMPTCPFDELTYLWSNGSTDSLITGLVAATYTVEISNPEGCSVDLSFEVVGISPVDTMVMDTMLLDSIGMDTIMMDTMSIDTMSMDTMMMDTMMMDTMTMDTMMMDTMSMDTMMMDTMSMDTMMMDTMMMDTVSMDTVSMDTISMDTMSMDTMTQANFGNSLGINMFDRDGGTTEIDSVYFRDAQGVLSPASLRLDGRYSNTKDLSEVGAVCFVKTGRPIEGLSVQDLTRGQRIILQFTEGCPQDRIALDVSGEGAVSGFDLSLMKNILLDRISAYPDNVVYKFVKTNEGQIDISASDGDCIILDQSEKEAGIMNVTAIKLGDLKCSE